MSLLLLLHVRKDLWNEFNNWLWISNLKDVVQIKLRLVGLQPILSSVLHFFSDLLWHWKPIAWSVNHESILSSTERICHHCWLRHLHRYIALCCFCLGWTLFLRAHRQIWSRRKLCILNRFRYDLWLLCCLLRWLLLWLTAPLILLHAHIFIWLLSYQGWLVAFCLESSGWPSLWSAQSLFYTTVGVMLRIAVSLRCSDTRIHFDVRILWFSMNAWRWYHLRDVWVSTTSWVDGTASLRMLRGFISLESSVSTWLLVR